MLLGRLQRAPDDVTEVVVLYARGRDEDGCDDAVAAAWSLKGKGILVVTVCAAPPSNGDLSGYAARLHRRWASALLPELGPVKGCQAEINDCGIKQV